MKAVLFLYVLSAFLLTSCDGGRPLDTQLIPPDTTAVYPEPINAEPDTACLHEREKTGAFVGEWMEVGRAYGTVSEIECIALDTTGFSTRTTHRWVFKSDSLLYAYGQEYGTAYYFKLKGNNDTIEMVDNHFMYYDTLRITRLDADYFIVASVKKRWVNGAVEMESVVYKRRK